MSLRLTVGVLARATCWFVRRPRAGKLRTALVLLRTGGVRGFWHRATIRFAGQAGSNAGCNPDASGPDGQLAKLAWPTCSPSVVVYTALFGGRDRLSDAEVDGVQRICFTDDAGLRARGWHIRHVSGEPDPLRAARKYKILGHRFLPPHRYSLWLDANLELAISPLELIDSYARHRELVSLQHPERCCTYREADMVRFLGLDDRQVVERQMCAYRRQGFPPRYGLLETSLLLREDTPRTRDFNERWWCEVSRGSLRDQLSIMYTLWKSDMQAGMIRGGRERCAVVRFRRHVGKLPGGQGESASGTSV